MAKRRASFLAGLDVDLNDGAAVRRAEVFAQAYAAGSLAQNYGCLPKDWKIHIATRDCFRRFEDEIAHPLTFIERLLAAIEHHDFVIVPAAGMESGTGKRKRIRVRNLIAGADGFLKAHKDRIEVWIKPERVEAVLPRWSIDKKDDGVRGKMAVEAERLTAKRKVQKRGKAERFYVFHVPSKRLQHILEPAK